MDAHTQAFAFFGGVCRRGIYDNLKTVVTKILLGKERTFNPRFLGMAAHHLFEPVACTPAAGWEKGQVENQVGLARRRFFCLRRRFEDLVDLNQFLLSECLAWAKTQPHPEDRARTIWEVYEQEERPQLTRMEGLFDGFVEREVRVSTTSLVASDRNHYSVDSAKGKRTAQVRAYADRVVIVSGGEVVGEHGRQFSREKTGYDPWHYLPVLKRQPGALRNGAPFQDWELPAPIQTMGRTLKERPGGDREFVDLLNAIKTHGGEAVARAAREAIALGAISFDVVFHLLSRQTEAPLRPPPSSSRSISGCITCPWRTAAATTGCWKGRSCCVTTSSPAWRNSNSRGCWPPTMRSSRWVSSDAPPRRRSSMSCS